MVETQLTNDFIIITMIFLTFFRLSAKLNTNNLFKTRKAILLISLSTLNLKSQIKSLQVLFVKSNVCSTVFYSFALPCLLIFCVIAFTEFNKILPCNSPGKIVLKRSNSVLSSCPCSASVCFHIFPL